VSSALEITDFQTEHQPWFEKLNRAWIEQYFWMEAVDYEVLQHPQEHIILPGGAILMALYEGNVVGTVALRRVSSDVYEFTKMAVDDAYQGKKIGKALALSALQRAKALGARKVILYSNTKLTNAIALYRKIGFLPVPLDGPYKRSDIKMELSLDPKEPLMEELITVRSCSAQDANTLMSLGIRTFRDTFDDVNTPENMMLYINKAFTIRKILEELEEPRSIFFLAEVEDQPIGYARMRNVSVPEELTGFQSPIELERLYVDKKFIGKRVGHFLMTSCINHAKGLGHDVVWLGVWENNLRAIAFYEKWGFEKFGQHVFMLGNDPQQDFLYRKKLT